MRTTVDLPDDLMRAAKAKAAESGESLKELFTRALIKEMGRPAAPTAGRRVSLPLIAAGVEPSVDVTSDDIAEAIAADDAERFGRR